MSKSSISILNFEALYNILFELKEITKFEVKKYNNEDDFIKNNIENNPVIISHKQISNKNINSKNIIVLDNLPLKLYYLIDKINVNLLKQKYSFQSNFTIKNYKLDFNSRVISYKENKLKLTEREIEIILFLNSKNVPQNINVLQKEVWGYSENLETHTVETHIYRLRKKINEKFNDENFLISSKEGYKI
tara:strand:- start:701 stop:1270 length:570 start_codon:yes stop_codon:yes gene_type:complete